MNCGPLIYQLLWAYCEIPGVTGGRIRKEEDESSDLCAGQFKHFATVCCGFQSFKNLTPNYLIKLYQQLSLVLDVLTGAVIVELNPIHLF